MSDTQAAMHEFRFLDERRKTNGLTPAEEQRWQELAHALGIDLSQQQQAAPQQGAAQGYYGPDGQWYPYAPQAQGYDPQVWGGAPGQWQGYYPPQQQGYYGPDGQWYAAPQQAYYPPQPQGYYGPDGQWYPAQQQAQWGQPQWDAQSQQWVQPTQPQPQWDAQSQQWVQPGQPQWDAQSQQWVQPSAPQQQQQWEQPAAAPQQQWESQPVAAPPPPEAPQQAPEPSWQPQPAAPWAEAAPPPEPPVPTVSAPAQQAPAPEPAPAPAEAPPDEVMEVGDEEVVEIPVTAPPAARAPAFALDSSDDPVADLRNALSLDDDEPASAPAPVAARAPAPEVYEVSPSAIIEPPAEAVAPAPPPKPAPEPLPQPAPLKPEPAFPSFLADIDAGPVEPALVPEPAFVAPAFTPLVAALPPVEPRPVVAEVQQPVPSFVAEVPQPAPVVVAEVPSPAPVVMAEVPLPAPSFVAEVPLPAPVVVAEVPLPAPVAEVPVLAFEPVAAPEPQPAEVAPVVATFEPEPFLAAPLVGALDIEAPDFGTFDAPTSEAPAQLTASPVALMPDLEAPADGSLLGDIPPPSAPALASFAPDPAPAPQSFVLPASSPSEFSRVATPVEVPVFEGVAATPIEPQLALLQSVTAPAASAFDGLALPPDPAPIPTFTPPPVAVAPELPATPAQGEGGSPFGGAWSNEPEAGADVVFASNWDAEPVAPVITAGTPEGVAVRDDDTNPGTPNPVSGHESTSPGTPMPEWENAGNGHEATSPGVPIPEWGNDEAAPVEAGAASEEWANAPSVEVEATVLTGEPEAPLLEGAIEASLGGDPAERVELATTAEFLPDVGAPAVGEELSIEADLGEFVVESGSAAALATGVSETSSSEFDDAPIELATNSDFIDHPQLTGTGEQFTAAARPMAVEEDVLVEGEVISGELDVQVEATLEDGPNDSWAVAMQPSPAPPPVHVAAPAPAPAARPFVPPLLSAAPALPVAAPLVARQPPAGPPAAAPPQVAPVAVPVPVASHIPQVPTAPVGVAAFDRSGTPLKPTDLPVPVAGEHRVILHTMEGGVKRGSIRDADLSSALVSLATGPSSNESVPRDRVKAIFFMLAPGSRAPAPEGAKVRVTFRDGRQVAGFSKDHKSLAIGFFVVPADNRTNTERIFIFRHAVSAVQVEG